MAVRRVTHGALIILTVLVAGAGCATVFRPVPTSPVGIESEPAGARVVVNDEEVGVTPIVANLSRRRPVHRVRVEAKGCVAVEREVRRSTSWWALATVLYAAAAGIGGLQEGDPKALPMVVGGVVAFDWWSGALFKLPRTVHVRLKADVAGRSGRAGSAQCGEGLGRRGAEEPRPLSMSANTPIRRVAGRGRTADEEGPGGGGLANGGEGVEIEAERYQSNVR